MVSLDILKKRGYTTEAIKAMVEKAMPTVSSGKFVPPNADPKSDLEKWMAFQSRLYLRVMAGREYNISHHKHFHALDLAWETPFNQVNPTLLRSLIDSNADSDKVKSALNAWGFDLDSVMETYIPDPKTPDKKQFRVNLPSFFQVTIPLVKAILTIRMAKIMNDRRTVPFLDYSPAISTAITRLQCEVISDRIEVMAQHMGYFESVKQAVFTMLLYSFSIMLPMEEWFEEWQEVEKKENGQCTEKVDGKERHYRLTKEGIRYAVPHPAKVFMNRAYRPSSINTDTGVDFVGYWKIVPYKEIRDNEDYWNKDRISIGSTNWWSSATTYFDSLYGGCVMDFPQLRSGGDGAPAGNDREVTNADMVYSKDWSDKSITLTEYWEKVVPKDIGIGDYDCPVWTRFVVAGDGSIVFAKPVPYAAPIFMAYDIDDNREKNASLGLEILPFQDHLSNLMSQFILSVKQNLSNVVFYDTDLLEEKESNVLKNMGEKMYRMLNWIGFSGQKLKKKQANSGAHAQGVDKIIHSQRFVPLDTQGQLTAMKMVLDLMDRVLVMSPQESAQSSSHELRAEEVRAMNSSTSTRGRFTAIPVDEAMDAMKRQLYIGLMSYGKAGFYAAVSHNPALVQNQELLKELGFTWDETKHLLTREDKKAILKVEKKDAILIDAFASHRDSIDRADNTKTAVGMAQALAQITANPQMFQLIGGEQIIDIMNTIHRLAGFPRDFVLTAQSQQNDMEMLRKEVFQALQQVAGQLQGEIQNGFKPMMEGIVQLNAKIMMLENALQMPPVPIPMLNAQLQSGTAQQGLPAQASPSSNGV